MIIKKVFSSILRRKYTVLSLSILFVMILVFSGRAIPALATTVTVRDDFATQSYSRQDGTQNWTTDWIETNDNGLPDSGFIRIVSAAFPNQLRLDSSDGNTTVRAIDRSFDLTDANSATWTFDWVCRNMEAGDYVELQTSADGGGSWTTIDTLNGNTEICNGGNDAGSASYDISALIDSDPSDSAIRFEYLANASDEEFDIDFVQVAFDIEVAGVVFRDYNNDGIRDALEPGVPGITVTAYLADGSVADTAVTDANGHYVLDVADGTDIRVEFTGLPSYLDPGPAGVDSVTTVTFVTTPAVDLNLGIHNPDQYCDNGAELVTSCFVNGSAANFLGGPNDVLVRWDYALRGGTTPPTHISERANIGSVWGLAYDRIDGDLYASAFLKRYVGLLNGPGAIFITDPSNATANGSLWLDVNAAFGLDVGEIGNDAARGLSADPTARANDPTSFYQIGKIGIGDLDISEDYNTLWFTNLFDKTLYSLEIDTLALTSFAIPTSQCNSYTTLRIDAGNTINLVSLVDGNFNGDAYNIGGTTNNPGGAPSGAQFNTFRNDATSLEYMVPAPDGTYDITLYFYDTSAHSFDATVEGTTQTINVAASTETSQTFTGVAVADSMINFLFNNATTGTPMVSGIEITATGGVQFQEAQPFGIDTHDGDVYLGLICTAEYSQNSADLDAYIYRLPNSTGSLTQIATFDLDYTKGPASTLGTCPSPTSDWHPWATSMPAVCESVARTVWPQPMLTGIEFDTDDSLILTFMDRLGHQLGNFNFELTGTAEREAVIGGDILRLYNDNGTYTLESNGTAGPLTAAWLTAPDNGVGNNQGPGGGEFYQDDADPPRSHNETPVGGLHHWFGTGEVVATTMDPIGTAQSGGVLFFNNTTGATTTSAVQTDFDGYEIYVSPDVSTFGKANGIGDLELICLAASIEIGNRVWHDIDADGVQDPGEPGIPGVDVTIYDTLGNSLGTVQTDANGEYIFTNSDVTGGIQFNTDYVIRIDDTATVIESPPWNLTFLSPPNTDLDLRDSDPSLTDVLNLGAIRPEVQITTGRDGNNNHTYDFGFSNGPTAVSLTDFSPNSNNNILLLVIGVAAIILLANTFLLLKQARSKEVE